MGMLYLHFGVIARGGEEIYNILFFVVVFIIWLVKMIAGAKSQKNKEESAQQPLSRAKPEQKRILPAGGKRAVEQRLFGRSVKQIRREKAIETASIGGPGRPITRPTKKAAENAYSGIKPSVSIDNKDEVIQQEEQVAKPILMADLVSRPISKEHMTSDSFAGIELPDGSLDKSVQAQGVLESLKEFDSPDTLRNAILYYEILGKPLSERDSFQHQIF